MKSKSILIIGKLDESLNSSIIKMIENKNTVVLIDQMENEYWKKFSHLDKIKEFSFCPISSEKIESWFVCAYYSLDYLSDICFDAAIWFGEGHPSIKDQVVSFCEKNKINLIYA